METSQHRMSLPVVRFNRRKENGKLKGPLRVLRLCLLSIILPGVLIAGPLYLRYRVYSEQMYPLGMSDMRLVDSRISTTWCQRQLVRSNATYSAYLLSEQPQVKVDPAHVSMVRYLDLDDDMKEYWGFYLLRGSSVTISTCCRWPGASLIVIRGHNHLRECAYIGDDSSEEEDEMEEIRKQKETSETAEKKPMDEHKDGESNEPTQMKRARPGVVFHGPQQDDDLSHHRLSKEVDGNDADHHFIDKSLLTKAKWNLERNKKGNAQRENKSDGEKVELKTNSESSHESYLKSAENATQKDETEEVYRDVLVRLLGLGDKGKEMLLRLSKKLDNSSNVVNRLKREILLSSMQGDLNQNDEHADTAQEEGVPAGEDVRGSINGTTANDMSNSEFWSSFSSSEERLLSCAGLILNLPLTPHTGCERNKAEEVQARASLTNKLTYKVPSNGYYFFVFSSENEIQPNYIRVHFHLEKKLYNVSNPVAACTNTTDSCSLPLNFFSKEKVVLELPVNSNDSLWNQEYVVVSTCEPRTIVYAACVIAVPILILLFAF